MSLADTRDNAYLGGMHQSLDVIAAALALPIVEREIAKLDKLPIAHGSERGRLTHHQISRAKARRDKLLATILGET